MFPQYPGMQLLERTKVLLNRAIESGATLREIAQASGTVPEEWLKKFVQKDAKGHDKVPNPGVRYVQALHDFLKKGRLS